MREVAYNREWNRAAEKQAGRSLGGKTGTADFGCIKAVVGSEQVNIVINWAKQQEQMEVQQNRAVRRKYNQ